MTATTARPAYEGPRTKWTRPDGMYRINLVIPSALLPEGNVETPAIVHGMRRVAQAYRGSDDLTGMQAQWTSVYESRYAHLPVGSGASVEISQVPAGSDAEAQAIADRLYETTGAVAGRVAYVQPTEYGATSGPEQHVKTYGYWEGI